MKTLVIAPQPFFSPRGTPFSVYYRTLVTAELGVEVDLLTYGEGADVDIPGLRIIRIPRFPFLGPIKIGPSIHKLFLDFFVFWWAAYLLIRNRYDFIHAHEESVFFCLLLKPLFGTRLVYDMHSSLPQQLTNFNFTKSKALIGLFDSLENASLKSADAVITICPDLQDVVRKKLGDEKAQFLIENSIFDDVRLRTNGSQTSAPDLEPLPADRRFIVYAGTFESYQGLDILVRAFEHVIASAPDAFLLVIGGTPEQVGELSNLARELGIDEHCRILGRVPKSVARDYIMASSVLASPRREGTNTPLKVYELLASGIPIVATRIYSHTQVLDDEVCFLVEPEAESMAQGLIAALEDDDKRSRITASAIGLYNEKYSRTAYKEKLKRVLESVKSCVE